LIGVFVIAGFKMACEMQARAKWGIGRNLADKESCMELVLFGLC